MLSGAEMGKAAEAAGQTPSVYMNAFGDLSRIQQDTVATWFGADVGILAMGVGPLTVTNIGIDADDDDNDKPDTESLDGEPGEATIYVKVSDAEGRLIPPGDGRNTFGQSFKVTASYTATGDIVAFTPDTDGTFTSTSTITAPPGTGNKVASVPANPLANPPTSARVDIRVGPNKDKIAIANADVEDDETGTDLMPHHQKLNFSLTDGSNLPFQIKKTGLEAAEIIKRPGATLTPGAPYDLTLTVNEFGNAPANSVEIDIRVVVVVDNVPPEFVAGSPTAGSVPERAHEHEIETFQGMDANNQAVTFSIARKLLRADDDADQDEIDNIDLINGNAKKILDSLDTTAFGASGVLKTKTKRAKGTSADQPDFYETPEDDPETIIDESVPDPALVNEYVFTITLSDGTLTSAPHEFTLTVTDVVDLAAGSGQKLTVKENNPGGDENAFGFAPDNIGSTGETYSIGQQIDNLGNIVGSTPEDADDVLFGIDRDTGAIYLKLDEDDDPLPIDYESGIVTYTVSVKRGNASGIVVVSIEDVNEAPKFSRVAKLMEADAAVTPAEKGYVELFVLESAVVGTVVSIGQDAGNTPTSVRADFPATDEDVNADNPAWSNISYDLWYDSDLTDRDYKKDDAYTGANASFTVDSNGTIRVNSLLDTDADDAVRSVHLVLRAVDSTQVSEEAAGTRAEDDPELQDTLMIKVSIIDTNVAPEFIAESRTQTHKRVSESADENYEIFEYIAEDEDGDTVRYRLRDQDDSAFFVVEERMVAHPDTTKGMVPGGVLKVGPPVVAGENTLDYEVGISHTVEIQAYDTDGDTDEIVVEIEVNNENDETPTFLHNPLSAISVVENRARGTKLGNSYEANDPDGFDITYSLTGADAKSFQISDSGALMTLESLDYDRPVPCAANTCNVIVNASDGAETLTMNVAITVTPSEDSVSTLSVTKANPVPGTTMGDANTALGNTKESINDDVPERPADLPNKTGAPLNFVETDWASWGTVLRIQVTAQSPDLNCGSGNECVIISLNSDSAGDTLQLEAYRMDTPEGAASNENKFVAAVMLVELDGDATDKKTSSGDDIPVYAHTDGTVARLQVDEEDEIEIEFYNLRGDIEVENEAPEISNFAPEHESAFNDPDVEYTFTVTDSHSGLPEPEDLPDADGDDAYMPAVALISKGGQCETAGSDTSAASKARRAELTNGGFELVGDMANINDDESLYCPGDVQSGEFDAGGSGYGFAPIRDDKDFDEIDDGFDVETTIVLRENEIFYVTFVACDNAGNCSFFDPDGNDESVELAQITVDTEDPVFVEARTGLTWDSTDNEYDDNRSFIQVIFNDLTKLNTETVEIDDFVVEGHSIKDVQVFENPDSDDVDWGAGANKRYAAPGRENKRDIDRYRDLENVVFIELEDELLADETPDVTIVPNGVEDKAGNEQDDGDNEADDWISPKFTIVSIVSTRETSQDEILAGDDDEVTVVVTTDERLDSTRPTVTVTYVNAPAGKINTKGTEDCDDGTTDGGTRERGEIMNSDECADSSAATGGNLNNSVEKVSNTEWIVTITEPKDTGYYNFRISGKDRSPQENPGSEGVSPSAIVTDFFDADGDVNVDDAIFFEGDINLPKPQVRVSGVRVENNEADVEFRSPLFVELDFAANHSDNCANVDNDERMANCMNENREYAEDNFDDIVVTSFVLDGVDLTDSVKTTDNQSFLVSLESISIGDHTAEVQAVDQAGNVFEDTLEIDFEVNDRDPFEKRLSPGWNLVSLPGEPADSSIASVFGPGVEVRTVYSYDPVIPGGWMVAVRETLDSDWQGDLTEINGRHGYWVLSDAIQDWEVSIPRLAGGAAGTGTPIQPPVIPLYAGWNLIPVTDISGNGSGGDTLNAVVYLQSLEAGVEAARVLGFDTIRNQWETVLDPDMQMNNTLEIGAGYWIFVREATSLVPSGYVSGGGSD